MHSFELKKIDELLVVTEEGIQYSGTKHLLKSVLKTERLNAKSKENFSNDQYLYECKLIQDITGKPAHEVMNNFTLPELIRLMGYLDFMKSI